MTRGNYTQSRFPCPSLYVFETQPPSFFSGLSLAAFLLCSTHAVGVGWGLGPQNLSIYSLALSRGSLPTMMERACEDRHALVFTS